MKEYKFPQVLRKLMEENKVSDYKLQLATGISNTSIYNYKFNKRQPILFNVEVLADYFDVSIDYLLYGEENDK